MAEAPRVCLYCGLSGDNHRRETECKAALMAEIRRLREVIAGMEQP